MGAVENCDPEQGGKVMSWFLLSKLAAAASYVYTCCSVTV